MSGEQIVAKGAAPLIVVPCPLVSEHDGDTMRFRIPVEALWPDVQSYVVDVRLAHVNAAELSTPDGKAALVAVNAWLTEPSRSWSGNGPEFELHVWGREKYGRCLADVADADGGFLSTFVAALPGSKPEGVLAQLAR